MPDHRNVYQKHASQYDALISREDHAHNIPEALRHIHPFSESDMVDVGAGTGRLTCMFAPIVKSVVALDASPSMLDVIGSKLDATQRGKLRTLVSDLRNIPLPNSSADVITAGWTIGYITNSDVKNWRENLAVTLVEMKRVLRRDGTIIVLETLGTGNDVPIRPELLGDYYNELEQQYGFLHKWIRTDYLFETVEEADRLCRFFFGDELGDQVVQQQSRVVPECTGVWWLRL